MLLKNYQKQATKELLSASIKELNKSISSTPFSIGGKGWDRGISIVFKALTWSWKTVVMQNFLRDLSESNLKDEFAFLWISVNDLSKQSKQSFEKNMIWSKLKFSTLSDIQDKEIKNNEILFINWESIRSIDKQSWEWKVLAMKDNEKDENLPIYLKNTHKNTRKIILIVDESHKSLDTPKAQELIMNYIKPILQIEVSATPDSKDYNQKVEINIDDVISEWMIKKEILINENLESFADKNLETDKLIMQMSLNKQKELKEAYCRECRTAFPTSLTTMQNHISPLLLIQLPSESKKTSEIDKTKLERIINILDQDYNINFENQKLAIWLSEDKTNKELIDLPDSKVEVLIFKQAIATGWDCPRAQILVMFREIKTITFEIQTVWRILRMPEQKHYKNEILNKAYVYTDLEKAEISIWQTAKNLIKNIIAYRKEELYKNFSLKSVYKKRIDYKDIWFSFYNNLAKTFVDFVDWNFSEFERNNNLIKLENYKNFQINDIEITNKIISDWKILVDIDNHTWEKVFALNTVEAKTEEELVKMQFDNFARNQVWPQFTNIARSYTWVIEALYYSLDYYFFGKHKTRLFYQKLILSNKEFFINLLNKAKDNYLPIRKKEIEDKKQENEKNIIWTIPKIQAFSENAKIYDYKKNILNPCYLSLDSENEKLFIENYLENNDKIDFWYKNWTSSETFFAIPYTDNFWEINSFYPDFIVYFKNQTIWIFDPKSWFTLSEWVNKAIWLEKYILEQNKCWKKIIWWLVEVRKIKEEVSFLINKVWNYNLENREDFEALRKYWKTNFSVN